jgi:GR25 family glycosyltransferase involved in LPS biosynthesis
LSLDLLPPEWDVVFLTALYADIPPHDPVCGDLFGLASYGGSTAAYLVSDRGARKLLRYALPISWAADGFMGFYMRDVVSQRERIQYNAYMLWPPAARNGSLDGEFASSIKGSA